MNEAKKKAIELVELFYNAIPLDDFKGTYKTFRKHAKQCALICIDEMIITTQLLNHDAYFREYNSFLYKVKEEINNI